MKNYKQILFLSIIFFSLTLLFSACTPPQQEKTQKKQNMVTKKILPPDEKQKAEQPKPEQIQEQTKKTAPVITQKQDIVKTIDKTENQQKPDQIPKQKADPAKNEANKNEVNKDKVNKKQVAVKKTEPVTLPKPVSKELQTYMENDKKEDNRYISEGKLDPFMSPITKKNAAEEKKVINRKLSPLEKLDLSQLKLVAIINMQSKTKNIAMVQESSGKGYMVKVGTYIGTNNGRIIEIKNDEIILKERIENFNGVFEDLIKKMKLQKKDNG